MTSSLRIAVADDEPEMLAYYQKCLPRLGHQVVSIAKDGRELVEQCRTIRPDLIVTDIKMPHLDGIEAATVIYQERPVPVILVSAFHDEELVRRAEEDHVVAYLVKPIKQADLQTAIGLCVRRFGQFQELLQEATDLRHALEDHKEVENAMRILIRKAGLDETAAFLYLQKRASDEKRKLIDVARKLLAAA